MGADVKLIDQKDWRSWVLPKLLYMRPIHRWLVFPHSFADNLVKTLIDEWKLGKGDLVVDPFGGAGTTVLSAKEKGVPAKGFDLSPLAVLSSRVKVRNYDVDKLRVLWNRLHRQLCMPKRPLSEPCYPELVVRALKGQRLDTFHYLKQRINALQASRAEREFFMLALVSVLPRFSGAVATGGWLSWTRRHMKAGSIHATFARQCEMMLNDLEHASLPRSHRWTAIRADARALPLAGRSCDAVITSPPYPNRHDYTRVFGIELMFAFLSWEQTRRLRYQSFHSHPEARPKRPRANGFAEPGWITRAINRIEKAGERDRIPRMLHGYFLDTYLFLREVRRILRPGGRVAVVVGNAQYQGIPLEVDTAVAEIGEQVGLVPGEIRVVRERGNSAQQMKSHGRRPSRESVVILRKK